MGKSHVNLSLDHEVLRIAKLKDINLSEAFENMLREMIMTEDRKDRDLQAELDANNQKRILLESELKRQQEINIEQQEQKVRIKVLSAPEQRLLNGMKAIDFLDKRRAGWFKMDAVMRTPNSLDQEITIVCDEIKKLGYLGAINKEELRTSYETE